MLSHAAAEVAKPFLAESPANRPISAVLSCVDLSHLAVAAVRQIWMHSRKLLQLNTPGKLA